MCAPQSLLTPEATICWISVQHPSSLSGKYECSVVLPDDFGSELHSSLCALQEQYDLDLSALRDDHGSWILKATSRRKPGFVDSQCNPIPLAVHVYSGSTARLDVVLEGYRFRSADGEVISGIRAELVSVQVVDLIGVCRFGVLEDGLNVMELEREFWERQQY
jgi:Protein of unknown function (DUF2815)